MKTMMGRVTKNTRGNVLILVLILLVVGGLVLTPLLGFMSTGLMTGQVYERKTDELYAADAGVEHAIWRIQTNNLTFDNDHSGPWDLAVNGKNVTVEVYREDLDPYCGVYYTYQILSTAATQDGGNTAAIDSTTTIDAHIRTNVTYSSIMDHLITVQEYLTPEQVKELEADLGKLNITCPGDPAPCMDCSVCKKAYNYDSDAYRSISQECKGCIAVYNFPGAGWPKADALSALYLEDVEGAPNYDSDTEIDLGGNSCPPGPIYINDLEDDSWPLGLGPLYVDGKMDIVNKSSTNATLKLNGTLYITGDTTINGPNDKDPLLLTLDLNGNTIFVSSNTSKALQITQCTVKGPGVIIAVGDVKFAPKMEGGGTAPVFVLSVSGTTSVFPSGDIYGAIAGDIDVDIGSGKNPSTIYPSGGFGDLTLPFRVELRRTYTIASWEINPP